MVWRQGESPGAGPERTCLACRRKTAKQELLRFVINKGLVVPDYEGRGAGRGAYCCRNDECFKKFRRNTERLARSFRAQICGVVEVLMKEIRE